MVLKVQGGVERWVAINLPSTVNFVHALYIFTSHNSATDTCTLTHWGIGMRIKRTVYFLNQGSMTTKHIERNLIRGDMEAQGMSNFGNLTLEMFRFRLLLCILRWGIFFYVWFLVLFLGPVYLTV